MVTTNETRRMKLRSLLVSSVAALFVLQAPVCALACIASADASPSDTAQSPCHDEASNSAPAHESNSHEDCGCGSDSELLVSQASHSYATPTTGTRTRTSASSAKIFLSALQRLELAYLPSTRAARDVQSTDLPPTDILLEKSTLIL